MYMACLDNTQAYNAFVFHTLKYIWTCVIWVCYHQGHHTQVYLDLCHLGLLSSKPLIV